MAGLAAVDACLVRHIEGVKEEERGLQLEGVFDRDGLFGYDIDMDEICLAATKLAAGDELEVRVIVGNLLGQYRRPIRKVVADISNSDDGSRDCS